MVQRTIHRRADSTAFGGEIGNAPDARGSQFARSHSTRVAAASLLLSLDSAGLDVGAAESLGTSCGCNSARRPRRKGRSCICETSLPSIGTTARRREADQAHHRGEIGEFDDAQGRTQEGPRRRTSSRQESHQLILSLQVDQVLSRPRNSKGRAALEGTLSRTRIMTNAIRSFTSRADRVALCAVRRMPRSTGACRPVSYRRCGLTRCHDETESIHPFDLQDSHGVKADARTPGCQSCTVAVRLT